MRTISALEVRARFGQVIDEAAAGERFIVERAGTPIAAIVPLRDLEEIDPDRLLKRRLDAVRALERARRLDRGPRLSREEIVDWIREGRERQDVKAR
jgi:prevent-host-death family protein